MSQSIASSVVIKDPKHQYFENNGNLFGAQQNMEVVRNFSKSGSLGFIGLATSDETMINALASQRII